MILSGDLTADSLLRGCLDESNCGGSKLDWSAEFSLFEELLRRTNLKNIKHRGRSIYCLSSSTTKGV